MEVRITGQQELFNALKNFEQQAILQEADQALKRAGMNIIAEAQMNLRNNHTNTTGRLSQSGRVQRTKEAGGGYDVGFMSGEDNYAGAVEFGRRPGKMPPPDAMAQYVYKKHHLTDRRRARAWGWALAVKIGAKGTRPHPYFEPAVKNNQMRVLTEVADAVRRTINRLTTNV